MGGCGAEVTPGFVPLQAALADALGLSSRSCGEHRPERADPFLSPLKQQDHFWPSPANGEGTEGLQMSLSSRKSQAHGAGFGARHGVAELLSQEQLLGARGTSRGAQPICLSIPLSPRAPL